MEGSQVSISPNNSKKNFSQESVIIDTKNIFSKMVLEINSNPLPPNLQKRINIKCIDCEKISNNVNFHFVF